MSKTTALRAFLEREIISPPQYDALIEHEKTKPISIHWEVRVLLMSGISLLSGGVGMLIYKNIDTIGHKVIIALIIIAIAACKWYVYKKRLPFTLGAVKNPNVIADNILVLGCSLFLILEAYLQYQYHFFGERYGIATLIPALVFFASAYRFDHIGVLTMGLTAFVSWAGISTTPVNVFKDGIFDHEPTLVLTGILTGIVLISVGLFLNIRQIKPHFTFSYVSFGLNLASIACLYGSFQENSIIFPFLCFVFTAFSIWYARREQSYFILLAGVIYGYIALTILMSKFNLELLWLYYLPVTCLGVIMFLLNVKKILNKP